MWISRWMRTRLPFRTCPDRGSLAHHTARGRRRLGGAIQLVSVSLDVVQAVGDDDVVLADQSLDRRELGCATVLLSTHVAVHVSAETQCLIGDMMDAESCDAGVRRRRRRRRRPAAGVGDALLERFDQLPCAMRLPGRGVPGYDDEL